MRYVDDIFMVWTKDTIINILSYLNHQNVQIKVMVERAENVQLALIKTLMDKSAPQSIEEKHTQTNISTMSLNTPKNTSLVVCGQG